MRGQGQGGRPPVRTGLIGIGRWGRRLLAPLSRLTALELCCNRSDEDARRYVREHHPSIRICEDVDELLTSPDLDAVVVATPIRSHAELVRGALRAGKHVFVEKPLCTDSREAAELRDLAIAGDRVLFVGHLSLYDAGIATLARIVRDDPLRSGVFTSTKFGSFTESIVWNLLSHVVATATALTHSTDVFVTNVKAFPAPSPDLLTCCLRGGDDSAISVVLNRRARTRSMWGTFLTKSGRTYWWEPDELHVMGEGGYDPVSLDANETPLDREIRHFVSLIEGGGPPDNLDVAVAVVRALEELESATP